MSRSSERDWEKVYREAAARYMKFKEFFLLVRSDFFLVQIKEKFWSRHERRKRKRQKNVVKCLSMKLKLTENMIFRHSDCLFLDAFMTCFFAFFDHEVFIKTREMKRERWNAARYDHMEAHFIDWSLVDFMVFLTIKNKCSVRKLKEKLF